MKARKPVTIYDVAKRAGVSHTAVAKTINGGGNSRAVSPATALRIQQAIRDLNYRPRAFRTKRTGIVAVTYATSGWGRAGAIADPFYGNILAGLEQELEKWNYSLLIAGMPESESESNPLPAAVTHRYAEGVIGVGYLSDVQIRRLAAEGPLVLLDHALPDGSVDAVVGDDEGGMYQAIRLLLSHGHRRIGYINAKAPSPNFAARLAGYRRAMAEHVAPLPESWIVEVDALTADDSYGALERLFAADPTLTAVACANDSLALQAMKYAFKHGVAVPDRLSLIGHDDIPASEWATPGLSTVRVDRAELSRTAVRMLLGRMNGSPETRSEGPRKVVLPAKPVIRGSTGPVAGDDRGGLKT